MLQVKIQNGDEMERTFYVNDLQDLKRVQDNLVDDFQKVLAQDESEEKIQLERILDASPCDDADELIDWIHEMREIKDDLDRSDYDNVLDMIGKLEEMSDALSEIYNISREYY